MHDVNLLIQIILLLSDGHFHSGEKIAGMFSVSRTTINNYIKILKNMGLEILSISGRGYSLHQAITLLDKETVLDFIPNRDPKHVFLFPIIDSTNLFLLNRVNEVDSGTVCLAEYQSQGRGRRGRKWYSPFGSNLYLSMYWRFCGASDAIIGISQALAVTVAKTLRSLSGKNIRVKWPNDLYLDGKKMAGLLVEMVSRGRDLHTVIGIGINLRMSNTEGEIDQQWTNLGDIDRNRLAAKLIDSLHETLVEFERTGLSSFIDDWHKLDYFRDKPVKLLMDGTSVYGIARGVNGHGGLLLEQEGTMTSYVGGEISLRLQTPEDRMQLIDQNRKTAPLR